MSQDWGIHWFRRDLRVAGNAALASNFLKHNGRVVGLFAFDQKFLSREELSFVHHPSSTSCDYFRIDLDDCHFPPIF